MIRYIDAVWRSDEGAVTIDWVVLAAATVGLSIAATTVFVSAVTSPESTYHTNWNDAQSLVETIGD